MIGDESGPYGPVYGGDRVIFFNFRGDRAIEISRAFTEESFDAFDRLRFPKVMYAGMMEYDGGVHIPPRFLVTPPKIKTLRRNLASRGINNLLAVKRKSTVALPLLERK